MLRSGHERTMWRARARARCSRRRCCVCVPKHAEGRAFVSRRSERVRSCAFSKARKHRVDDASRRRPEAAGRPRSRLPRNTLEPTMPSARENPREPIRGWTKPSENLRRSSIRYTRGRATSGVEGHGRTTGGLPVGPITASPPPLWKECANLLPLSPSLSLYLKRRARSSLLSIKVHNKRTVHDRFLSLPFFSFFLFRYPCRARHDHLRAFNRRKIEGG